MVIEWLVFEVDPELREQFIYHDQLIWTTFFASNPGFLGKEVWLDPKFMNQESHCIHAWECQRQLLSGQRL